MPAAPEVSGRAFLGLIRHVRETRGNDFLSATVQSAGEATQAVFARPIQVMAWHPYPAFAGWLRALDRAMGKGDGAVCRELGAVAGKRDLGTVLRVYVALASAERLIRSCEKVWPSYYRNAGRMEAVAWAPEQTTLRIHGFAAMDVCHCKLMEGWMISTMDTIGFRVNSDARESVCASRGGPWHEFTCSWTRKR